MPGLLNPKPHRFLNFYKGHQKHFHRFLIYRKNLYYSQNLYLFLKSSITHNPLILLTIFIIVYIILHFSSKYSSFFSFIYYLYPKYFDIRFSSPLLDLFDTLIINVSSFNLIDLINLNIWKHLLCHYNFKNHSNFHYPYFC